MEISEVGDGKAPNNWRIAAAYLAEMNDDSELKLRHW
jgi:hypothetical protein